MGRWVAVVVLGVATGCAGGGGTEGGVCQEMAHHLVECGRQVPDNFQDVCQANPAQFAAASTAQCDASSDKADTSAIVPLWNGEGDSCTLNLTCSGSLVCIPAEINEVYYLGLLDGGKITKRVCAEVQGASGPCDSDSDCQSDKCDFVELLLHSKGTTASWGYCEGKS
jgi:hypothetical protein